MGRHFSLWIVRRENFGYHVKTTKIKRIPRDSGPQWTHLAKMKAYARRLKQERYPDKTLGIYEWIPAGGGRMKEVLVATI